MASTSPVRGSSATTAPVCLARPWPVPPPPAGPGRWSACRSLPGMAGLLASTCRTCPRLSTTTCRWPSTPVSQSLYWRSMPNLPMICAGLVLGELRIVQFLLADFAGVADDVRHHAVLRIEPPLRLDEHHFREEIAVRIDERQVGRRQFLLDHDGHVLGLRAEAPHLRQQVVVIQVQALGRWASDALLSGIRAPESG